MKKLPILFLLISANVQASRKNRKTKAGVDINLKDSYHPWNGKDGSDDPSYVKRPPTSFQHRIAEYLLSNIKPGDSLDETIFKFEDFSNRNHMGMTLGTQKGDIIESSIRESLVRNNNPSNVLFLEFGSHIGDGTLRIIREIAKSATVEKCTVLSYESNQEWLGVGTSIVRHALLAASERKCQYIPMLLTDDLSHIADHIKNQFGDNSVSGIFLDHNHAKFYRDVNILRERKLIRKGTLVIADNALRHSGSMSSFIEFMRDHSSMLTLAPVRDPYPDQILVAEWKEESRTRVADELYIGFMGTYCIKQPQRIIR
jgi:predicted O-methyltransferase YrrM